MKHNNKVRTTNLAKLLQIGQKPTPSQLACIGFFDGQSNFYPESFECNSRLFLWEWVLFPEIVECAKHFGVEVPEDLPFDINRSI